MRKWICCAAMIFLCGCGAKTTPNLNSVLWVQTAAEYQAGSFLIYNAAMAQLEKAVADQQWTAAFEQTGDFSDLPPAIIFDLDETVLNNSRYQAQRVIDGTDFTVSTWDHWLKMRRAESVAGAVEFINHIQSLGIEPIFISNRECRQRKNSLFPCPQESDTIRNLSHLGITGITEKNLLLKNEYSDWGSEKKSRREFIAEKYRIIMVFGDDLGDFIPDVKKNIAPEKRKELSSIYHENWGTKWFILPNPMYGSWLRILKTPHEQYLTGLKEK